MTAEGNSTLGFIWRNILTNSEVVKNLAYKQLVRPVLEYASAAWGLASNTVGWEPSRERQLGSFVASDERTGRLAPPVSYRS